MKRRHPHPILNRCKPRTLMQKARTAVTKIVRVDKPPRPTKYKKVAKGLEDVYSKVEVIVVNYRTLHLLKKCVNTLLHHYPEIPLLLIDNYSTDGSADYVSRFARDRDHVQALLHHMNMGHGPAMHYAIKHLVSRPFVFTLDTDMIVHQGGFLQLMLKEMASDNNLYAID